MTAQPGTTEPGHIGEPTETACICASCRAGVPPELAHHCPGCGKPAYLDKATDLYEHTDGSDADDCQCVVASQRWLHPAAGDRDTVQRYTAAKNNLAETRKGITWTLAATVDYIDWVCGWQAVEVPAVAAAMAEHLHELVDASFDTVIDRWRDRTGANPAAPWDHARDDPRYAIELIDLINQLAGR